MWRYSTTIIVSVDRRKYRQSTKYIETVQWCRYLILLVASESIHKDLRSVPHTWTIFFPFVYSSWILTKHTPLYVAECFLYSKCGGLTKVKSYDKQQNGCRVDKMAAVLTKWLSCWYFSLLYVSCFHFHN